MWTSAPLSKVTDRVLEDVQEWQTRPLESAHPVAFFDAIRVKIRSGAAVKNMAVHLGIGVRNRRYEKGSGHVDRRERGCKLLGNRVQWAQGPRC
ncbi:MAG: transposase [Holdemanella sp.]